MTATTEKLEANKKLARDYIDQVFNQHNPGKAADFVTDNAATRWTAPAPWACSHPPHQGLKGRITQRWVRPAQRALY
jgi:hypothetical protein